MKFWRRDRDSIPRRRLIGIHSFIIIVSIAVIALCVGIIAWRIYHYY
jgi:hypothetical protein